jgi:hypothetical protein
VVRTVEQLSPEWIQIGEAVQHSNKSIREIARERNLSDTAVRKMMKRQGWVRAFCKPNPRKTRREPIAKPAVDLKPPASETQAKSVASYSVKELTGRGRSIILDLMAELEFLNSNYETLADMVDAYLNGERDDRNRAKLLKALDHETRSKTANYLATALAKLNDAAPGKKEEARDAAETAGQNSAWGDDLDSGPVGRPN